MIFELIKRNDHFILINDDQWVDLWISIARKHLPLPRLLNLHQLHQLHQLRQLRQQLRLPRRSSGVTRWEQDLKQIQMANCLPFGFVSGVSRLFVPSFSFKMFQSAPLPTVQESVVPKAQCFWQWKHVETGHTVIRTVPYYCHTGHAQFRCDFSSDFSSIFAEAVTVRLWVEKWKLVTCNLQAQCVNSHIYIYMYILTYVGTWRDAS